MRDVEWEKHQLPCHITHLTFRGRFLHVDQRLAEILDLQSHSGSTIRVLDIGCGVLPFGSPTLHDLWDTFHNLRINTHIVGVDENIPRNVTDMYSDIQYVRSLNKVRGTFDIVRILHVLEHIGDEAYAALRNRALGFLREGGMLIATQKLVSYHWVKEQWRLKDPATKIAQKTPDGTKAVDLLPEVSLPYWMNGKIGASEEEVYRDYAEHRERVFSGKESLPHELNTRGHESVLVALTKFSTTILDHECHLLYDPNTGSMNTNLFTRDETRHEDYFLKTDDVSVNFWKSHTTNNETEVGFKDTLRGWLHRM